MSDIVKTTKIGLVLESLRFFDRANDLVGVNVWRQGVPWDEEKSKKFEAVRNYTDQFHVFLIPW